jgi:hypothetical protein
MKYFKFNWTDVHGKEILDQGEGYYYTTGIPNVEEMKQKIRVSTQKPSAVIQIHAVTEISQEQFDHLTAHLKK